ncbi:hypothetical protein ACIQUL_34300 [Streptomyces sp. NPDC090303]|uniref:hypothetical protein n=1 Tax=Streptomyces sp. NPDC090303 TaxID=3365960 RepID=UPI0037F59AD8
MSQEEIAGTLADKLTGKTRLHPGLAKIIQRDGLSDLTREEIREAVFLAALHILESRPETGAHPNH